MKLELNREVLKSLTSSASEEIAGGAAEGASGLITCRSLIPGCPGSLLKLCWPETLV